jgi:hypothetical protein
MPETLIQQPRTRKWRRYPARTGLRMPRRQRPHLPEAEIMLDTEGGALVIVLELRNPTSRPVAFWSDVAVGGGARVVDGRQSFSGEYRPLSGATSVEVRDGGPEGRLLAKEEFTDEQA